MYGKSRRSTATSRAYRAGFRAGKRKAYGYRKKKVTRYHRRY